MIEKTITFSGDRRTRLSEVPINAYFFHEGEVYIKTHAAGGGMRIQDHSGRVTPYFGDMGDPEVVWVSPVSDLTD